MYDSIVAGVSFADVITAIVAIAALLAAVLMVQRGVAFVLSHIGGADYTADVDPYYDPDRDRSDWDDYYAMRGIDPPER